METGALVDAVKTQASSHVCPAVSCPSFLPSCASVRFIPSHSCCHRLQCSNRWTFSNMIPSVGVISSHDASTSEGCSRDFIGRPGSLFVRGLVQVAESWESQCDVGCGSPASTCLLEPFKDSRPCLPEAFTHCAEGVGRILSVRMMFSARFPLCSLCSSAGSHSGLASGDPSPSLQPSSFVLRMFSEKDKVQFLLTN